MQSRVYESVDRPSVRLFHRSTAAAACGGFAAERRAGREYRSTAAGAGAQAAQQQRRSSTAFSSKCGQCHVDSRGTRLNTSSSSSSSSSYITPTGSKTVTYSTNINNEKHKTHKISYTIVNIKAQKSSSILYSIRERIPYCLFDNIF